MAKIITFSGRAQSGKDSCARIIKQGLTHKGLRIFELACGDYVKVLSDRNLGTKEMSKEEARPVWQYFGTDKVRGIDCDFWVKVVSMTVDLLKHEYDVFIITDARFENEMNHDVFDNEHPIFNILVKRETESGLTEDELKHESEQLADRDDNLFDAIIRNDGDLMDLEDLCIKYVEYFADWFRKENAA